MNDELFAQHGRLIRQRWPALWPRLLAQDVESIQAELTEGLGSTLSIDGIQLTSRHDRVKEAELQAASLPEVAVLHLYGTGLGDLPRALLGRTGLKRLEVKIMNGALFALMLRLLDQQDWLADPRVELMMAGDESEIRLPFFALPPELQLVEDAAARIRDRLVSEIELPFASARFDAEHPAVTRRLAENRELLTSDGDVASLFGLARGKHALIVASGPTLQTNLATLQAQLQTRRQDYLLISVDTALAFLLRHGIRPDIVVTIDDAIHGSRLPADQSAQTTLVYYPTVPTAALLAWQGPRKAAYSRSPMYQTLRQEIPKGSLHSGGSVIHPAVDLAVQMGCQQVILLGTDFAFPGELTHSGWADGALGPTASQALSWTLDGHGRRVKTNPNFSAYRTELERYIARHPEVHFWNSSREGAEIAGCSYHPEYLS
ncbi:motility associated factor glycosyltransferase family protein [Aeromonas salmonicida]|uniref:motility associated factor glycosyltransferase family protein n=1 Tax=Aeromonas salmonicida TaxID=645 RepID=UPI000BB626E1|nr:6-hydroxymethylpterin diphosphokinase MptE-like protein [Aeromonas salmonicida]PBO09522.1 motility accessory factor Maf-2 [Aeromonas salmonicida]